MLLRVERGRAWASRALDAELERARLAREDRALATEIVYGVLRQRARLDRALETLADHGLERLDPLVRVALRAGAYQILWLDRVPDFAAVDETVGWVRARRGARMAGLANALLRRVAAEGEPPPTPLDVDPLAHLLEAESFPPWLARRLIARVGPEEAAAFARAQNEHAPVVLRANTLRVDAPDLARRLAREAPDAEVRRGSLAPEALLVRGMGPPHHLRAYAEGLFAVQDEAAQIVAHLVAPQPGDRVLDACAGVGTKSTHLAALMRNCGRVDAVDASPAKARRCREAAARLGAAVVRAACSDLAAWPEDGYDAALVDAPCSGLGVLRRHPEAKWFIDEDSVARFVEAQRRLLAAAAPRVRPGGLLVYSVCTFLNEETDGAIAAFLRTHDAFVLERPAGVTPLEAVAEPDGSVRTWTHRHGSDAFYAARLRRRA